ncbi:TolC family protein [Tautonia plasticadhaerens]|uniref:Outer membrane efflux protein n=1 Tax=Tautonia plasticadhaerens TaxID=2527974 RepID=A0A518H0M2_9BACT|nr:TolC family protein [Tautonia plasticadhaerens]QDV34396.1 Outer membrane efflux protein [Tautonia plasticadhaerens]
MGRPRRLAVMAVAALGLLLVADARTARAQRSLLDELILIATRGTERGVSVGHERQWLDPPPPHARQYERPVPEERMQLEAREVPLPREGVAPVPGGPTGRPPGSSGGGSTIVASSRRLMVPEGPEDEGPPDGLTLDAAIDQVVRASLELHTKSFEIPIAEADALQARLPKNPWLFGVAQGVPYGNYREGKPGEIQYGTTIVVPVDLTGKYRAQGAAGDQAVAVVRAQFRDAVRREVDELYHRWVEVLRAREAARFARATVAHLDRTIAEARDKAPEQLDALEIERDLASYQAGQEDDHMKAALRDLAETLSLPPEAAEHLRIRDLLRRRVDLPDDAALMALALEQRPDLVALREDVGRARLDVRVAKARAIPDMWVLGTPFQYRQHPIEGERDSVAWGGGLLATIPIIDRNQGNVRHAELTVGKTMGELRTIERRVAAEVGLAAEEVRTTGTDLDQLEGRILPLIGHYRRQIHEKYLVGQVDDEAYADALKRAHTAASKYHETLVRHRRALLRLNTALGCRFAP